MAVKGNLALVCVCNGLHEHPGTTAVTMTAETHFFIMLFLLFVFLCDGAGFMVLEERPQKAAQHTGVTERETEHA